MKNNYTHVKAYNYDDMPEKVQAVFNKKHKTSDTLPASIFFVNSLEGKAKNKYTGKKIICKWTWENKTFIIERSDDYLFDWLIDNGLDLKKDEFIIIKH